MCQFPKYWSANPQVLAHHLGGWRKVLNLTLETAMSIVISNAFTVIEGRPVTSSRIVAEYFGKQHKDTLRAIRDLIADAPELERKRNFALTEEEQKIGATTRKIPLYWMDQKGFCILAMGFTGAKALEFKCAFYDEFERMKNELEAPATITPAEQLQIQQAVARRAKTSSANYQTIYRAIKVRFQIPRYTELPTRQFAECLKFIDAVDLKVPEAKTAAAPCENQFTPEELAASPEKPPKGYTYQVSAKFLADQRTFVYYWRYLFRRELELFEEFLYRTESPRASRFHEAVHNLDLMRTEDQLRRLGFPMDGLPCYQHYVRRLATAHQR